VQKEGDAVRRIAEKGGTRWKKETSRWNEIRKSKRCVKIHTSC
jgi:hypothetical protein